MRSGYKEYAVARVNRPPTRVFPEEFFVEDFEWSYSTDDGILDENNGRFCVTPEYPNGTYAYAPRSLRKILYTSGSDGDIIYGKKDLTLKK